NNTSYITMYANGTPTAPEIYSVCHSRYGCLRKTDEGHEAAFAGAREKWNEYCAKWDCKGLEARQRELIKQEQEELEKWQRRELF
ncbi:MAG: hypothetical protein QME12_07570, partial [Nanoarchaeota archaeon]|nr:hypothetical protein [Nanoarchaeota archaeon]